jgi:hypothetical protein
MSNRLDVGTGSGGNTLFLGDRVYVGSAVGVSTAIGQALSNRAVGTALGSANVTGVGYAVAIGIGTVYGASLAAGISLTNRAIGLAAGTSLAQYLVQFVGSAAGTSTVIGVADAQYLVQFVGSAAGTSTVIGVADAASKFKPLDLFVGYSSDGTSITIPISSVIGLTAEEADVITGDWREVLQAILLRAVEHHRSFTWSEQLRTYNAFGMNMLNSSTYNRHFSTTFYTHQCGANVVQEP